ncbi:hypothetical protein XENORESO_011187, partial [Xenotaenia resolanae]
CGNWTSGIDVQGRAACRTQKGTAINTADSSIIPDCCKLVNITNSLLSLEHKTDHRQEWIDVVLPVLPNLLTLQGIAACSRITRRYLIK